MQTLLGLGRLQARAKTPISRQVLLGNCSNRVATVATALATAVATVVNYIATVVFHSKRSGSGLQSENSTVAMVIHNGCYNGC